MPKLEMGVATGFCLADCAPPARVCPLEENNSPLALACCSPGFLGSSTLEFFENKNLSLHLSWKSRIGRVEVRVLSKVAAPPSTKCSSWERVRWYCSKKCGEITQFHTKKRRNLHETSVKLKVVLR